MRLRRLCPLTGLLWALVLSAQVNVLTYRNDNARTGQNLNEPLLTPAKVQAGLFGRRFTHSVDGNIFAQPLYIGAVPMAGRLHNVLLVVTEHDSVYAFDADDNLGGNAAPLWQVSFIHSAAGVTPVPYQDVNCSVIYPELGISGTPVIDPATYTVYLVAYTKEVSNSSTRYIHRLHALDIRSGKELPSSPVEIAATAPGSADGGSEVTFVPFAYKQRAALLLANGMVYIAWSSECDFGSYHGWITAYRADTLQQTAVFLSTPNGSQGSFWGAGAGPAADNDGNIFILSANGTFDEYSAHPDLSDSILKLTPQLLVSDYFTPFNQHSLSLADLDLGSSGALLLPGETGNDTHRNLLVAGGKEGRIYLIDRDAMGGYSLGYDRGAVQSLAYAIPGGIFGPPAYFSGKVYFSGAGDPLKAYQVSNARLSLTPASTSPMSFVSPCSSPIISASGSANGIVWIFELADGKGALHAFDAADVSQELFRDAPGSYNQFAVPMEADGKVYVGTADSVIAYGLLAAAPGSIAAVLNAASFNPSIAPGSLISIFGSNLALGTAWAQQIPLPASLADTSVLVNGSRAPLLYVSPGQINAQLPAGTPTGTATVAVMTSGQLSATVSLPVVAAAPQIFMNGTARVLAVNQDGSINSQANPAASGSAVAIFLTGQGSMQSPAATIGGLAATLTYAGAAPQTVGVAQMNMYVPGLAPGDYPLQVSMSGAMSNSGLISIH